MQAAVHVNNTSLPAFLFSGRRIDADPSGFLMSPDYFVRLNTLSRAGILRSVNLFLYGKFCGTDES